MEAVPQHHARGKYLSSRELFAPHYVYLANRVTIGKCILFCTESNV